MLRLGLNPSYVLDEIATYEIQALLKYQYLKDKEGWEQARMIGFITARSNGAKINKIENLLQFEWEKKAKETPKLMTDEDLKRLRSNAQTLIENNFFD